MKIIKKLKHTNTLSLEKQQPLNKTLPHL